MKVFSDGFKIGLLILIAWKLCSIDIALTDHRPVRTYHFHDNRSYDAANVDTLNVCDRFAE